MADDPAVAAAALQAYYDCMSHQGFNIVGFLTLAGDVVAADAGAITVDLAATMLQGARNGDGCGALLTADQRNALARNQYLSDISEGRVPGHPDRPPIVHKRKHKM
jgi:hypothetical protein